MYAFIMSGDIYLTAALYVIKFVVQYALSNNGLYGFGDVSC